MLQYNENYPYGLQTSNSWIRENSSNDYLYNAGNELNGNSGWHETYFRGYDPVLGRFNQVDLLAYASSSHTPYNYAFNDPVFYNDPMGDYPDYVYFESFEQSAGGSMFDSPMESKPWYRVQPGSGNNWMDSYGFQVGGPTYGERNAAAWVSALYGIDNPRAGVTYSGESYYYVDHATENLNGTIWMGATVVSGERWVAQQAYTLQWATIWAGQNNIISSTAEAKRFYETGDGSPRLIDQNTSMQVVRSPEFNRVINLLVSGKANRISSSFDVDMTSKVFHIGKTNVDYETTIIGNDAYTVFTLFVRDGFWDPNVVAEYLSGVNSNWVPDDMGPNLETEGSHPYPYTPVVLVMKFTNPGTYGK